MSTSAGKVITRWSAWTSSARYVATCMPTGDKPKSIQIFTSGSTRIAAVVNWNGSDPKHDM